MTAQQPARPIGILGDAERCCPAGLCVYRASLVELYLSVIRDAPKWGDDPGEAADAALSGKGRGNGAAPSNPGSCHNAIRIWDVQVEAAQLRREGREVTAVAVAGRLCPWSLEDGDGLHNPS